jgi:hypothetical protein
MAPEIALDMFRGNFPGPPNFHLLLCVGKSAAFSITSAREIAVSRCLLQKPHKQKLLSFTRL